MKKSLVTLAAFAALGWNTAAHAADKWIGTWAASPVAVSNNTTLGSADMTVRQTIHISQGGESLRLSLTNEFGSEPLSIHAVDIAFLASGSSIVEKTTQPLLFNGKPDVTIAPGKFVTSDELKMKLPIFSDLVISMEIPAQTITNITEHPLANQVNFLVSGNHATEQTLNETKEFKNWYLLKDLQVKAGSKAAVVVTLGDSITDGAQMAINSNHRWPDILAARLAANKKTKNLAIMNEGISGNRILHDLAGPKAIDRFDRDVLAAPGVKYLTILEGINDIGRTYFPRAEGVHEEVTAQQLIDALKSLVDKAHARGIKVFGATLTPYEGAKYFSAEGEKDRQTINTWIRTSNTFDGVIDFEKAVRDPNAPTKFDKKADCGDHLHPNDVGYQMMADSIELKLFTK